MTQIQTIPLHEPERWISALSCRASAVGRSTIARLAGALVVLAALTTAASGAGYLFWKSSGGAGTAIVYGAGHATAVIALIALALRTNWQRRLRVTVQYLSDTLSRPRLAFALVGAVLVLRLVWIWLIPTEPSSDNQVYHGLATKLAATGEYGTTRTRAYWPMGYPLFLSALYTMFGSSLIVAKLANLALAAIVEIEVWQLMRREVSARAGGLALLLTVLWGGRFFHVDVISYDELTVALLLGSILLVPRPNSGSPGWWARWLGVGALLGFAILTRATVAVLPIAIAGWLWLRGDKLSKMGAGLAIAVVAATAVIAPWSYRNTHLFEKFVPLSTNAGINFYSSWAGESDGSFCKRPLDALIARTPNEAEWSAVGMQHGWAAIHEDYERAGLRLLEKQVHYLGSDNWLLPVETYQAALDSPRNGNVLKAAVHTASNAYYFVLMLIPIVFWRRLVLQLRESPLLWLAAAMFLSGWLVHTVFQAQARYHLIYLPFWGMLVAGLLTQRAMSTKAVGGRKFEPQPAYS